MNLILLKVLALTFIIYILYLCYLDYKFRSMRRRLVLFSYPLVFYANWLVCGFKPVMFISCTILFITLYLVALIKPNSFGTIDILAAPIFTIWFNEWSIVYSLCLIIANSLFWNVGLVKFLFYRGDRKLTNPFIITMTLVFILCLIFLPNNFVKILFI